MTQLTEQMSASIARYLGRYVRRVRWMAACRAVAVVLLIAMLWMLFWATVDRFVRLGGTARFALLLIGAGMFGSLLLYLFRLLRRPIDWRAAAEQIESRDRRFDGALATVVSHALNHNPGVSAQMLQALRSKVESQLDDPRRLVPRRPAFHAWGLAGLALLVFSGLSFWPGLGLPRLLARQVRPLAQIAPVTATRIEVLTGSVAVPPSQPLSIVAAVQPATSDVTLRMTSDGRTWSSVAMNRAADGAFTYTLAFVARDTTYQIAAGDAVSAPHDIRILRPPVARPLSIKLIYPEYVGKQPLTISSSDGTIEAPMGSTAQISVSASEPLGEAWIQLGSDRIASTATNDPLTRVIQFAITRDAAAELHLLSDRGVPAGQPLTVSIRAIADQPPVARIKLSEEDLLLAAKEVLQVPYEAADDFALAALEVQVWREGTTPTTMPLQVGSDSRECTGSFKLDLARWELKTADIVRLTLAAADRSGQKSLSASRRIIVCPHSIAPGEREQAARLHQAARLASAVASQLNDDDEHAQAAGQDAMLLQRALIDAAHASTGQEAVAFAALVDSAQALAFGLEQRKAGEKVSSDTRRALRESAAQLHAQLAILWQGRLSSIVLRQRANLQALAASPPLESVTQALATNIAKGISPLGLNDHQPDVQASLEAHVHAMQQFTESRQPIDWVQAARQWAKSDDPARRIFPDRLWAAGAIQQDPLRGRDLQLAARAARAIDALATASAESRSAFADELAALLADSDAHSARSGKARQALTAWAGETPVLAEATPSPRRVRSTAAGPSARDDALASVRLAQDRLTHIPQQLGQIEQMAQGSSQTALLFQAAGAVDPEDAWKLAEALSRYGPDASGAVDPIEQELAPALMSLREAARNKDAPAARRAAADARRAVAMVQHGLREARQTLLDRDPVPAARAFAQTQEPESRQSDPPAFRDALRAYFQVLNQNKVEVQP